MRAWLFAALAVLPTQAFALTTKCQSYAARDMPGITMKETDLDFVVNWERYSETFTKVIGKPFGVLVEAGINDKKQMHYLRGDNIFGVDVVILDSIIFLPDCTAK